MKFRDAALNESACINDTIVHDAQNPGVVGSLVDGTNYSSLTDTDTITWTASTDVGPAGISHYELAVGTSAGGEQTLSYKWRTYLQYRDY